MWYNRNKILESNVPKGRGQLQTDLRLKLIEGYSGNKMLQRNVSEG